MKEIGSKLIRMHIGDTYLQPQYPLPVDPSFRKNFRYYNRYCNTQGVERFREVLIDKLKADNNLYAGISNILATSGATNALSASVMSLLNSDDEILILTPCWPFFPGMVEMAGAKGIQVPFYTRLYDHPEMDIQKLLSHYLTQKTVALYLNTPNNPSGKVLNSHQVQQVGNFVLENNLWIISDEAYDGLSFEGYPQHCIASRSEFFERTISVFTFSKSFMFAGLRLGYIVAGEQTVDVINKIMVHQLYSPSTLSQYMMIEPVKQRNSWVPDLCKKYQDLRDMFMERLNLTVYKPEGTYFLFFPIDRYLNGRNYWEVIDEFLEAGVSVAPGGDFGADYEYYIRLCFTGEPPDRIAEAAVRINRVLQVS
jgi:N-succinyldiaminopimelate aminotransferase